jgi:TonB family protein
MKSMASLRMGGSVCGLIARALLFAAFVRGSAQPVVAQPLPEESIPEPAAAPLEEDEPGALSPDDSVDGEEATADAEAPPPDPLSTRIEATIEFSRLVGEERYAEAIPIGERVVALTDDELGGRSREAADARKALADAQRLAGEHRAAEETYLEAIEIYRSIDGPFSPLLIEPTTALGDNYHAAGQYLEAVTSYNEARTLSRRIHGLLNPAQIPLLDRMTQSLLELDRPLEAHEKQLEALRLMERSAPRASDEGLAAIYKYAGWLRDTGRYQQEREQYMRALRIIREAYGDRDVRQVPALLGIGNSFRAQRIPEGQGISALREALALLLAQNEAERNPLLVAEVLRDIGDWEVAFAKVDYTGDEYRRAWQLLGELPNGEELRKSWFTGPIYVLREPISQRSLSNEREAPTGHVLVRFDLDRSGRSQNVEVIESVPPGLKDEAVLRSVRRSRFRPQIVDGQIVPGRSLGLQFTFRYTLEEASESGSRRR